MKLEDLVAPCDLCAKIPAGAFEDSAFVWVYCGNYGPEVLEREGVSTRDILCPAPTLEEVVKGEGRLRIVAYKGKQCGDFEGAATGIAVLMGTAEDGKSYRMELCEWADLGESDFKNSSRGAAQAALKAWLRGRGVKLDNGGDKTEGGK